jgi:hypothetical protein
VLLFLLAVCSKFTCVCFFLLQVEEFQKATSATPGREPGISCIGRGRAGLVVPNADIGVNTGTSATTTAPDAFEGDLVHAVGRGQANAGLGGRATVDTRRRAKARGGRPEHLYRQGIFRRRDGATQRIAVVVLWRVERGCLVGLGVGGKSLVRRRARSRDGPLKFTS